MDEANKPMESGDDAELMALLLRLAWRHVERAEAALTALRGRGRGQFLVDRGAEIEAIKARLAKAGTVHVCEATLDLMHNAMRDVERVHDAIIAQQVAVDAELLRWRTTAGEF